MTHYRLVLPEPWERVPLGPGLERRVREIGAAAMARLPKSVPPDQVAPARRAFEERLLRQLRAARDAGGVDYYLPTDLMHGVLVSASFVVSAVVPDAAATDAVTGAVVADLLRGRPGAEPVTVADTVWVRAETVLRRPADDEVGEDVPVRRVEYLAAAPAEPRRWLLVTFTTLGDGDPESEFSHLMVELFDAIMSTWRWQDGATSTGSLDGAVDEEASA